MVIRSRCGDKRGSSGVVNEVMVGQMGVGGSEVCGFSGGQVEN